MRANSWGGRLPAYPPSFAQRYRDAGVWRDRTIAEEFHAVAQRFPDLELAVPPEQLEYRDLSLVFGIKALPVRLGPAALG